MVDANTPVTNPKLLEAINRLQEEGINAATEQAFFDELGEAQFLAPVIIESVSKSDENNKSDSEIGFFTLTTEDSRETFYPAFTDWEELYKWNPDTKRQIVITTLDNYLDMVLNEEKPDNSNGFVINPFGCNFAITKNILKALKNRFTVEEIKVNTSIKLATPKNVHPEMLRAINHFLRTRKKVKKAYLRMMRKNDVKSYLVIIDSKDYDMKSLCEGIFETAKPYLGELGINFINYSPRKQNFIEGCKPFYKRKFLGIF